MTELFPVGWTEYELIDSGGFEKLERFGGYVLRRPEPQAVWPKSLSEKEWEARSQAWFKRTKGKDTSDNERGEWFLKPSMPDRWFVEYRYKEMRLKFRLGMTSFKHVGLFPEQAANWDFIYDKVCAFSSFRPKVLNLFAYTGGASLAACAGGAEVTHVDSVRQVVGWARENMEASGLEGIRWIVEDAYKFVCREVKRGRQYHGLILDPPAYGRGPDGEKWVLEEGLSPLLDACVNLLEPNGFLILNLYSMGFSAVIAANLLKTYFPTIERVEYGELLMEGASGLPLPLSVYARF